VDTSALSDSCPGPADLMGARFATLASPLMPAVSKYSCEPITNPIRRARSED
jgi:hypothetical protein